MQNEQTAEFEDTSGEEITDTAAGWAPKEDWDAAAEVTEPVKVVETDNDFSALATADAAMRLNEALQPMGHPAVLAVVMRGDEVIEQVVHTPEQPRVVEKPTTLAEPELMGSSDEPTDAEIAAAEAILARRKPVVRGPDDPVSDKPIPINLLETTPSAREMQTRIMVGDMEVIGSAEKIEYVRQHFGITREQAAASVATPAEQIAQPMNPIVAEKITAEQEAGRRALAQQQARMVSHPRLPKTQDELDLEKPPVTIFRGTGNDIQQNLLRRPAVPSKGPGY